MDIEGSFDIRGPLSIDGQGFFAYVAIEDIANDFGIIGTIPEGFRVFSSESSFIRRSGKWLKLPKTDSHASVIFLDESDILLIEENKQSVVRGCATYDGFVEIEGQLIFED